MKRIILFTVLIASITSMYGQDNLNSLKPICKDSTISDIRESISYYKGRLSIDSLDQISYYRLGMCYYKLKNFPEAIDFFDKLIDLNPKYPMALSNRGLCKLFINQTESAINDFTQSVIIGQDPQVINGQALSEWLKENKKTN